jgi:maleylpyruvate isomerase
VTVTAEPLPGGLAEQIAQVDEATIRLLATLSSLTAADAARPSLCAGWTVGHVLTHLARNADGLRRSADGASRGERVPMYDSLQARSDDIASGAARPMPELTADVTASAAALRDTWSALRAADWEREMPHHRGPRPVSETPMMRLAEVEIHHVDLGRGFGPDGWPGSFVAAILSAAGAGGLERRLPDGVRLDLVVTDTGQRWSAGAGGSGEDSRDVGSSGEDSSGRRPVEVRGPSWAVAAWLAGRPGPAAAALTVTGGELPQLAPWP